MMEEHPCRSNNVQTSILDDSEVGPIAPVVIMEDTDVLDLSDSCFDEVRFRYRYALIGKFSHVLPSYLVLKKFLNDLKLNPEFKL